MEYHDIVPLDVPEARAAVVGILYPGEEGGRAAREGHGVVGEGDGQRRVGHLGSVAHLAHKEVVAYEQRLLHGPRGDGEGLDEEEPDEEGGNPGEYQRVEPLHPAFLPFYPPFAPEEPMHLAGDVDVEDDGEPEEPPVVAQPDYHEQVQDGGKGEAEVAISVEGGDSSHRFWSFYGAKVGKKLERGHFAVF